MTATAETIDGGKATLPELRRAGIEALVSRCREIVAPR